METILLDDDEQSQGGSELANHSEIEVPVVNNCRIPSFAKIYKEHTLFAEFLLKCLTLENSDGMIRIINKTLVAHYDVCDATYKNSAEFNKVLVKGLKRLETDPNHKFSHLKDMVETLKLHKEKKRVQLTTLATNLKCKDNNNTINNLERKVVDNIVIESDEEPSEPIIDLVNEDDVIMLEENSSDGKENKKTENNSQNNNLLQPQMEVICDLNLLDNDEHEFKSTNEPISTETFEVDRKIQDLEAMIAEYKRLIDKYEESEVTSDTTASAYYQCEKYKRKVVQLYKKLCSLIGEEPVKKHNVRLQVLEGHPPGPVRRLEKFINDNIGEDGSPLFPDLCDVIQCVMVANIEDNLGWNKTMIFNEASALFTQCGRALQKRRQRREYKDLLSRAPSAPDYDPADEDPVLLATLNRNRKEAYRKECDLLERYSQLQNLPSNVLRPGPSLGTSNTIGTNDNEDCILEMEDSEESDFEPPEVTLSQNEETEVQAVAEEDVESIETKVVVKKEPIDIIQMLEELGDDFTATVVDVFDPFLVMEISSDSSDDE